MYYVLDGDKYQCGCLKISVSSFLFLVTIKIFHENISEFSSMVFSFGENILKPVEKTPIV